MFEHAERIYPIYFIYPYKNIDDLKVELPLGWKISSIPKPFDNNAKDAQFTSMTATVPCTLAGYCAATYFPVLRHFIRPLEASMNSRSCSNPWPPGTRSA